MARHDRAGAAVLGAQLAETEATLDQVRQRLQRTRIEAPFDGVVVQVDSSQAIGNPVEQGKPLFTLAPLARYRVVLKVDERDVPDISAQLLSATSLLTIAAVYAGVKLLHEIAHAWAERRGGAEVHDMGDVPDAHAACPTSTPPAAARSRARASARWWRQACSPSCCWRRWRWRRAARCRSTRA